MGLGWNGKVMDLREAADVLTSSDLKKREGTDRISYSENLIFTFTPDFVQ